MWYELFNFYTTASTISLLKPWTLFHTSYSCYAEENLDRTVGNEYPLHVRSLTLNAKHLGRPQLVQFPSDGLCANCILKTHRLTRLGLPRPIFEDSSGHWMVTTVIAFHPNRHSKQLRVCPRWIRILLQYLSFLSMASCAVPSAGIGYTRYNFGV